MSTALDLQPIVIELNDEYLDDVLIDPETGEILDLLERAPRYDAGMLSEIASAIVRTQERINQQEKERAETIRPLSERIERINGEYDKVVGRLQQYITFMTEKAKLLVAELPERKAKFRGVGTFCFKQSSFAVISDEYRGMADHEQADVRSLYPDCFRVKYEPELKVIGERLKSGQNVPGFAEREKAESFQFKADV